MSELGLGQGGGERPYEDRVRYGEAYASGAALFFRGDYTVAGRLHREQVIGRSDLGFTI